jgi:peptidoglycan/LPS O-acetylase OafA/YrhL
MTSEHTGRTAEGRHLAARQDNEIEVPSTVFHYHDKERLASYRRTAPRPPAARAGALLTLLVGLSVMYAEWDLYGQSDQAQSDADWAIAFLIISTAGALRILMGAPGRHLVAGGAILVSGLGFLVRAFYVTDNPSAIYVFEITCGVLLVMAALMALLSPDLTPEPPARDPWG